MTRADRIAAVRESVRAMDPPEDIRCRKTESDPLGKWRCGRIAGHEGAHLPRREGR